MPHLATVEPAGPALIPLVIHEGGPNDDGRSTIERAQWDGKTRAPDATPATVGLVPLGIPLSPAQLDRPVATETRGPRGGHRSYGNPELQPLPEFSGVHAEFLNAVAMPQGEQVPAWQSRNTFRTPAAPWDAALYITPVEG